MTICFTDALDLHIHFLVPAFPAKNLKIGKHLPDKKKDSLRGIIIIKVSRNSTKNFIKEGSISKQQVGIWCFGRNAKQWSNLRFGTGSIGQPVE